MPKKVQHQLWRFVRELVRRITESCNVANDYKNTGPLDLAFVDPVLLGYTY